MGKYTIKFLLVLTTVFIIGCKSDLNPFNDNLDEAYIVISKEKDSLKKLELKKIDKLKRTIYQQNNEKVKKEVNQLLNALTEYNFSVDSLLIILNKKDPHKKVSKEIVNRYLQIAKKFSKQTKLKNKSQEDDLKALQNNAIFPILRNSQLETAKEVFENLKNLSLE